MEKEEELSAIEESVKNDIKKLGENLGLKYDNDGKWAVKGGEVDFVLYMENKSVPALPDKIPIIGFEIETSWRTRKHIKGDIMNLQILKSSIGVVVLCKKGFEKETEYDGLYNFTQKLIETLGLDNVYVWSEDDVKRFIS